MRALPFAAAGALALGIAAVPTSAEAKVPEGPKKAGDFENGGFVFLAPGIATAAFGGARANRANNDLDPMYQWGLGGGYMLRHSWFMATFGGRFEHVIYSLDKWNRSGADAFGAGFRLLGNIRVGGGIDWIYAYLYIDPGVMISTIGAEGRSRDACARIENESRIDDDLGDDCDYRETNAGFNQGLGSGITVRLFKGLVVGGEFGVDLAFLNDDDRPWERLYTFDGQLYVGWFF